ncbi:alpha/beta hydrolase [Cryobacterium breve]|uniref:Alpha/beta hydrolase n=1 Tax=Cryobacterium breve TaxID=1259258 RepID=A0ABY2J7Y8_9MICO|nr:alpha/beta hydrolase [Cryobacterium sp. TmT3-12]TFD00438.1 alpha/beta hydrolase [Cryobacterium breve]
MLCFVSALGASLVQTVGGTVAVKDMRWETASGMSMSALLYKPDSATATSKAPVIITSHGWWNNREMQDANSVELSRRGFVVISIDMYGHGNSDYLTRGEEAKGGTGMYDAVQLAADLPYVDAARIGTTGHSNGARAANFSVALDNDADEPLIAAVLLVDNDGVYRDPEADNEYFNLYGTRDVGIVADQYDEFFFRSYDADGVALTAPRDFITTSNAQSFLQAGTDPVPTDQRKAGEVYTDTIDGRAAMRVIYTPAETHPWGPFSQTTTGTVVSFFDDALGEPTAIAAGSQVWQFKALFNGLGLVGFAIFLVAFTRALLETRAFASLRSTTATMTIAPAGRTGLAWFWGGLVLSTIVSIWSYVALSQSPAMATIAFNLAPSVFTQGAVAFIAIWAALNGFAALVIMAVSYVVFGRKSGLDLRLAGVLPGWRTFFHGLGLALAVAVAAFSIIFVVDYFFQTDFRLWVLAVKAFTPDKLAIALLYLPFFAVYYVLNSVAINSFNRFTMLKKEWVNTAILALFNALGPIILVVAQYTTFFVTGELIPGFGGIFSIWLIPVIVFLAVTAVISRKIYRATNNPYIGGFLNALVVTVIAVTNTLTFTS